MYGKFQQTAGREKEVKERDKARRENIGKYYLDLSKLTFGALVLGSITCMISNVDVNLWILLGGMAGGIATTVILAKIGNQIFKELWRY